MTTTILITMCVRITLNIVCTWLDAVATITLAPKISTMTFQFDCEPS